MPLSKYHILKYLNGLLILPFFLCLLTSSLSAESNSALLITEQIKRSIQLNATGNDSALIYANMAYQSSLKIENDSLTARSLFAIGDAYYRASNSVLALDYYFKSLKIYEATTVVFPLGRREAFLVRLYNGISSCYFDLKMKELALKYSMKSLELVEEANQRNPDAFNSRSRLILLYNTGSLILQMDRFDEANNYFKKVEQLNRIEKDSSIMAGLLSNQGIILKESGKLDQALPLFMQSLSIWEALRACKGAVSVYNNLGEFYMLKGQKQEAIHWFNKAINKGTECGAMRSVQMATEFLTKIYLNSSDYRKAFEMQRLNSQLSDSLFNSESVANLGKFALQYEFEKQIREQENIQQEALRKQKQKKIFYLLLALLFFLMFLVIGLLLIIQKGKTTNARLRRDQLDLESKNLRLEKEKLQLELESKSKELATNVIYLVQKNEYITDLAQKLLALKKHYPEQEVNALDQIIRDLRSNADDKVWKEFELRFQDVHQDFYNRLHTRFPDLSPNERKLAAFLKLNMTSKDISAITFQSPDSIKIARSRLRKKLGLQQEDNLIAFLESV